MELSSILKTHFEKEDLEGKTLGEGGYLLVFQRNVKFSMWRTAKVGTQSSGGGGTWI